MAKRAGLPTTIKMRHNVHYIDDLDLSDKGFKAIGRIISIDQIQPNPDQPRSAMGDLDELAASVRERGILEPLLVRPIRGGYQIIAGERRYRAALLVGLKEAPCLIMEISDREVLEIALIENIQRKQLTAFEEAEAFQALIGGFGYTHEQLGKKIGKSRTTITETLSLNQIPEPLQRRCTEYGVASKGLLLQVARCDDDRQMAELVEKIHLHGLRRDDLRAQRRQSKEHAGAGEPEKAAAKRQNKKSVLYRFQSRDGRFSIELQGPQEPVERIDMVKALSDAVRHLIRNPQA